MSTLQSDAQRLSRYEKLRSAGANAINDYFTHLRNCHCLDSISISELVHNCMELIAVREYVDAILYLHVGDGEEQKSALEDAECRRRRINIRNHISMKIKEYIDGTF